MPKGFTAEKSCCSPRSTPTTHARRKDQSMRILVTGHKGYIGTVMVPMLSGAGHDVGGLHSDLFDECTCAPGIHEAPALPLAFRYLPPPPPAPLTALVPPPH